jgi:hypothetical protein
LELSSPSSTQLPLHPLASRIGSIFNKSPSCCLNAQGRAFRVGGGQGGVFGNTMFDVSCLVGIPVRPLAALTRDSVKQCTLLVLASPPISV